MGEKLLQVKGGSKKVFVRGESEIFWTITGMVKNLYNWSISYLFVIYWLVRVLDISFNREKEVINEGFLPKEIKFLLKTKPDSFPNFKHPVTEEGRPVGGGKVLILVHIYSKQI